MRIFLSAVTRQFKACRDALASDLRATGCDVRVQEDFTQTGKPLIGKLEAYVASCDAFIALVGDAFGYPADNDAIPERANLRSYTQWEYHFAAGERLDGSRDAPRDIYLYFAGADLLAASPVDQPPEHGELQGAFVTYLKQRGGDRSVFESVDSLCRQVLKDALGREDRPKAHVDPGTLEALDALRRSIIAGDDSLRPDERNVDAVSRFKARGLDEYRVCRAAAWIRRGREIDRRFTPLTLLLDQGRDAREQRWQAQTESYEDLRDILRRNPDPSAFVVLGPPGAGKSTLLHRLEYDLACEAIAGNDPDAPLTYYVPLNSYRPLKPSEFPPSPAEWLAERWAKDNPNLPALDDVMRRPGIVLLLDALNEMPQSEGATFADLMARWREFLADLPPGARAVFTCRSHDLSEILSVADRPVPHINVERLSPEKIRAFLDHYRPEAAAAIYEQLKATKQLDLFNTPYYLMMLEEQVGPDGTVPPGRAALFTGFVRSLVGREFSKGNARLTNGALLDARDRERVAQRTWQTAHDLPERGPLVPALSALAHHLLSQPESRLRIPYDRALALIERSDAEEILKAGKDLQVLQVPSDERVRASGDVLFEHQLLQEYFAARHIANMRVDLAEAVQRAQVPWRSDEMDERLEDTLKRLADYEPLPDPPTTGWEETLRLAASMMPPPAVATLLDGLAETNLPLAGRVAAQPDVVVNDDTKDRLRQALVARSRHERADLRSRIVAGRALGELGDPRFERRQSEFGECLLPPLVPIEGGTYRIGSEEGHEDERPVHEISLAPFAIGRFPVTNAEWRCFKDAGGYEDERWWDTDAARAWRRGDTTAEGPRQGWRDARDYWSQPGLLERALAEGGNTVRYIEGLRDLVALPDAAFERWLAERDPQGPERQPSNWLDPTLNETTQPVVGLCWFEVRAYCAWLSACTGEMFQLPTEAQWEVAARGTDDRVFAWGDGFDASRCNTFESHLRRTTPVGVFPEGDTPETVADMTGNVWEWTSSEYRPYPWLAGDGREDETSSAKRRVGRGGSWGRTQVDARCACRIGIHPGNRNDGLGFRLVCVSPIL